ncbi:MAG: IS200/IS605 family transposase [Gelidibacter sp.]
MANTYTQLYFHVVFAVKGRGNHIAPKWKDELYKYMTGITTNKNQKLMIINGMPNHVHLLIGTKPDCNLSDLIRDVKANSSKWVNERRLVNGKFEWQLGFGGFTVSPSSVKNVIEYIKNQEIHHATKSFKKEYLEFLTDNDIDFKSEYIFLDE